MEQKRTSSLGESESGEEEMGKKGRIEEEREGWREREKEKEECL